MCREEAKGLSSIKDQLDSLTVPLYGVVHEKHGAQDFKQFLLGEIFLDSEKKFYGPTERWMSVPMGFFRIGVWQNILRVRKSGIPGNLEGEGRLLGGVFVIGKGDQGILYEHREAEWGDHANITEIMAAVKSIQ